MPISIADKTKLEELNFYVEDMQEVYGDGWWNGMHRWMRNGGEDFQESDPCSCEEAAWQRALDYAKHMEYLT